MPRRCRATGCGRFIPAGEDFCAVHPAGEPDPAPDDVLVPEIDALRHVLGRVMEEVSDAAAQATLISRVASVGVQAARTRHQIGGEAMAEIMALIGSVTEEMEA